MINEKSLCMIYSTHCSQACYHTITQIIFIFGSSNGSLSKFELCSYFNQQCQSDMAKPWKLNLMTMCKIYPKWYIHMRSQGIMIMIKFLNSLRPSDGSSWLRTYKRVNTPSFPIKMKRMQSNANIRSINIHGYQILAITHPQNTLKKQLIHIYICI